MGSDKIYTASHTYIHLLSLRLLCSRVVEAVQGPIGATWFDSSKVSLPWHFCIVISQD
jgi:hypothetical protein